MRSDGQKCNGSSGLHSAIVLMLRKAASRAPVVSRYRACRGYAACQLRKLRVARQRLPLPG